MEIKEYAKAEMQNAIREGDNDAYLIIGPEAKSLIKDVYEWAASNGYSVNWLEGPKNIADFWGMVMDGVHADQRYREMALDYLKTDSSIVTDVIAGTLREKIKGRHHLFLPDIETIFYNLDIEKGGHVNTGLRYLWSTHPFSVHGSVKSTKNKQFEATLNDEEFQFYINNFKCIEL